MGFEPRDWDLSLETKFQAGGGYTGEEGGKIFPAKALDGQRYLLPLCELGLV